MANQWFYVQDGQQTGPVALEQLQQLLASATLPPSTQVWTEGMPQWTPADQVPGLLQPGASGAGAVPNYQGVAPVGVQKRPTSVTVLAIIGIVLGSLSLLGSLCGTIMVFVAGQQMQQALAHIPKAWLVIQTIMGFAISVILLAGSIGSLQLALWARKAMLAYAIVSLAMSVVGLITSFAFADPNQSPAMVAGMAVGSFIVGIIYPGCVLYFYTRPHVVSAFESSKLAI